MTDLTDLVIAIVLIGAGATLFMNLISDGANKYNITIDTSDLNDFGKNFNSPNNTIATDIETKINTAGLNATGSDINTAFSTGFLDAAKEFMKAPYYVKTMIDYTLNAFDVPSYIINALMVIVGLIVAIAIVNIFWKVS